MRQVPTGAPGYRWVVLGVAWASLLTIYLTRLTIGPLAPFLKEAFGLTNAQVGSLASASVVTYGPAMIVAGWLADRVGVRRMLIAGTLIAALCVIAVSFAGSYTWMLVFLGLSGLGTGCVFPSAVKAIVLWFERRERATALGLNQTALNVAGVIGAALLPSVAIALGWKFGFLFVGLAGLLICIAGGMLYRNPPRQLPVLPDGHTRMTGKGRERTASSLLRSWNIWMLSLGGLFLCIVEFSMLTHLVLYLKEELYFSAVAAGGLLAMTEAGGAFGKPASGFASDRFLRSRRKPVFVAMAAAAALMSLVLAGVSDKPGWLLYPALAILGLVAIGWGGLYATMAGEIGGEKLAATAAGFSAAILIVGAVVGPPLFGYVVDRTGSYQAAWLTLALSAAVSAVTLSLIREGGRHN